MTLPIIPEPQVRPGRFRRCLIVDPARCRARTSRWPRDSVNGKSKRAIEKRLQSLEVGCQCLSSSNLESCSNLVLMSTLRESDEILRVASQDT